MIINHSQQFAFIHIPKCAGTTVRSCLAPYDQTQGRFTGYVGQHSNLGTIDYVHIPLFVLKDYFPEEFLQILNYQSYAVIRDPFKRFPSSLSQHLKMYGKKRLENMDPQEVKEAVDAAINYLSHNKKCQKLLPHAYIHFQRQTDYVQLDGELIVPNVFTTHQISRMFADIEQRTGLNISHNPGSARERANQSLVFRNSILQWSFYRIRPILRFMLRPQNRTKITETFKGFFYVRRDERLGGIFQSEYVNDFISNYYKEDIELYQKLRDTEDQIS